MTLGCSKNIYDSEVIMGQLKVTLPEFPERFFNAVFILDPAGNLIYKHYKNVVLFVEHSSTPHDVYDECPCTRWIHHR